MCGIWAYLYRSSEKRAEAFFTDGIKSLEARGPEGTELVTLDSGRWAFTRLAINGLTSDGMQPFSLPCKTLHWMCNGEIYNSSILEGTYNLTLKSGSDCECIGHVYDAVEGDSVAFARSLDGVFAFVLRDDERGATVVGRDPYGVRPLFWGEDEQGGLFFGSERKSIQSFVIKTFAFPPGEVWTIYDSTIIKEKYHTIPWIKLPLAIDAMPLIKAAFEEAVMKRVCTTERPVAALLSGGLDSSLVCAVAQKTLLTLNKPPLQTFSIGLEGSTDIEYARKAAEHIGSKHTEVIVTADEMFAAIPHVIHDIESYDITTVRASVGNWLVAKYIREHTDCKVVLNGDGSDEVWGSYKYFRRAPSEESFDTECMRLLSEIHIYDVLRSDRSISSHGLEPRTPFLDKQFVALALSVQTQHRMNDKWFIRKAFEASNLLPECVLWREKEAFSDGVSSVKKSWYQEIQERVSIESWEEDAKRFSPVPHTAEAYYYRTLFEKEYTNVGDLWPYWMPRWSPETTDPSARTLV
jgi:asparagine synthase (glutamine-hydrolysing)